MFVFATCQLGAEAALKREVAQRHPAYRFAFSRPGFLTFKVSDGSEPSVSTSRPVQSTFARTSGISLGTVQDASCERMAADVWKMPLPATIQRIHVWPRDAAAPGTRPFEPHVTPQAEDAFRRIVAAGPSELQVETEPGAHLRTAAARGEVVLDCILLEPDRWAVGWHRVGGFASRWPGGLLPTELPPDAVSRAWLKLDEALRWSGFRVPPGARWADIGCAPGGASQRLLADGMEVLGVDPAAVDARVAEHPGFTHLRRRAGQAPRRAFRKVRWLTADMNVAPDYTLNVVEDIVLHPEVHVRGMLLTLKIFEWKLAESIPAYTERIRAWGFNRVRVRQLQFNRQEVCIAALKKPFRRTHPGCEVAGRPATPDGTA